MADSIKTRRPYRHVLKAPKGSADVGERRRLEHRPQIRIGLNSQGAHNVDAAGVERRLDGVTADRCQQGELLEGSMERNGGSRRRIGGNRRASLSVRRVREAPDAALLWFRSAIWRQPTRRCRL